MVGGYFRDRRVERGYCYCCPRTIRSSILTFSVGVVVDGVVSLLLRAVADPHSIPLACLAK